MSLIAPDEMLVNTHTYTDETLFKGDFLTS
jgi:hypothetical protein